jgi:hypothetical protein
LLLGRLVGLLCLLGITASIVSAAPAFAASVETRPATVSFDGSATPAGSFIRATQAGVDSASGSVYVLDADGFIGNTYTIHNVVDKFNALGQPEDFSALGTSVLSPKSFGLIAVDNSTGSSQGTIYLANNQTVEKSNAAGEFIADLDGGETPSGRFGNINNGLAVDLAGNVYITDFYAGGIDKFDSSGHFVEFIDYNDQVPQPAGNRGPATIAVDSVGNLFVVDVYTQKVYEFDSSGKYLEALSLAGSGGLIIDQSTDHIFVVQEAGGAFQGEPEIGEYDSSGNLIGTFATGVFSKAGGLAVDDATDTVYITDGSPRNKVYGFGPRASVTVPEVTLGAASEITDTEATLNGTINPSGLPSTYQFQYRLHGAGEWITLVSKEAGAGEAPEAVSARVGGLHHSRLYDFRLVASNASLYRVASEARSFTTKDAPPSQVETLPPGAIEEASARLGGWVNPEEVPTVYWFEYGPEDCAEGPCQSFPVSEDAAAGTGSTPEMVTEEIEGLQPGTTYHYRIVAKSAAGTTFGNDIVFSTDDPNEPGPPERGIELVNAPDKGNQPVYASLLEDGEHVVWRTAVGIADSPTGSSSLFRARRTPSGWQSETMSPPAEDLLGGGTQGYEPHWVNAEGTRYIGAISYFAGPETNAVIDLRDHTLTTLGDLGARELSGGGNQYGEAFGDRGLAQVYATTFLPLAATDTDDSEDLFAFDASTSSWSVVGLRPDGSDPRCKVVPARGVSSAQPGTSSGEQGERKLFFFTTPTDDCSEPQQLYVRDLNTAVTTAISAPALAGPLQEARFIRAAADGSALLFSTATKLAASDENDQRDIYLWREGSGDECLTCIVPDADVNDVMASPDLSYVYFTSPMNLVAGRGLSNAAQSLYALHQGQLTYVAPVDEAQLGQSELYFDTNTSGDVAIFQTGMPVTADVHGNESYRFEASTGEVQCVSCMSSGTPPVQNLLHLLSEGIGSVAPHAIDASGNDIVFETKNPLSPRDVNGSPDIYEWKNGKTRLITDGVTEFRKEEVGQPDNLSLNGISGDDTNVLFRSPIPLTGYELDQQSNIYVARIGGGFPPPPSPPAPCNEDACQGPLQSPPTLSAAASAGYSGAGNQGISHRHRKRHKKKRHQRHQRHHGAGRHANRKSVQG